MQRRTAYLPLLRGDRPQIGGWSLSVLGVAAAAAGVVLIVVRARLTEPRDGAQSKP